MYGTRNSLSFIKMAQRDQSSEKSHRIFKGISYAGRKPPGSAKMCPLQLQWCWGVSHAGATVLHPGLHGALYSRGDFSVILVAQLILKELVSQVSFGFGV